MSCRVIALVSLLLAHCGPLIAAESQVVRIDMNGTTLNADFVSVADNERPVSLIVHGTLAHKDMALIGTLQEALHEAGRDSLAINLSLGIDDRREHYPCDRQHIHTQEDALREIGRWIGWLHARGYADISLLGHSRGAGQLARFVAEQRAPIRHVTLIAPPLRFLSAHRLAGALKESGTDWLEDVDFLHCSGARVSRESFLSYYTDEEDDDLHATLESIGVPVLVAAGTEDVVVPGLATAVSDVSNPNIRLVEIDGADHFFHDLYAYDVVDAIAADVDRKPAIETVTSLADLSSRSKQSGNPIVLFVTEPDCPFCHALKMRVLYPMIRAGELRDDVLFREVSTGPGFEFRDWSGQPTDGMTFAKTNGVFATPTLLFFSADGDVAAPPMVGIANLELYEFYLRAAIDKASVSRPRQ